MIPVGITPPIPVSYIYTTYSFRMQALQAKNFLLSNLRKLENFKIFQNILGQISSRDVQIALEPSFEGKKIL